MPDTDAQVDPHITVRECVRQRDLCRQEIRQEIKSGLEGYTSRIETAALAQKQAADGMTVQVTKTEERAKSNTHRLDNWTRFAIGVAVIVIAGVIVGGVLAWKNAGG